eukprot:CAMPEP_0201123580 /NCGR_PEP_ID=MMETSP0850-20130426/7810_1 /ASSEMBLY_ACC=CAM_ASM_000622 /TAXON_ID=183588 /ORGANISM="Pseudo-nitzschia fraudulenta, Strain WWA7" /LENGTH=42 /DNA_ID= /DNA_START= /DNA_END= /DNA_ORIENTATION=
MAGCGVIANVLSAYGVAGDEGVVMVASSFLMGIQGWVNFAVI